MYIRFVNIVTNSRLNKKAFLRNIKTLRFDILKRNGGTACSDFIPEADIKTNMEELSQMIGDYNISNKNLSKDSMHEGAEMFIDLNMCPTELSRSYWNAIYKFKSRTAILASNIAKKANDDFKVKAIKIFTKIISTLKFKYISYHHDRNKSLEKRIDVKGKMLGVRTIV